MITSSTKLHIFQSLKLFREDLQEVIDIFIATGGAVTLSDGDQVFKSFDEMSIIKGAEVSHLILENDSVGIKLELQKRGKGLALTTIQTTDQAELTFYRTREFLRNKTRLAHYWALILPIFCIMTIMFCSALYLDSKTRNMPITPLGWAVLILVLCAVIILATSNKIETQASLFVTLKRRHEYPPFVRRNFDNLILIVISTLIGVAGTLLVQYLHK